MWWIFAGLMILVIMILIRAIIGPTVIDRLVSINAISSKISVIILLLAFVRNDFRFVDIAFVYMLCAFVGGIWILKVYANGDLKLRLPGLKGFEGDEEEGIKHDQMDS